VLELGRARLLERLVHGEVAVEAGDLECTPRLETGCREQEALPVGHSRARLDQHAERRRVDELDCAQVDDQTLGALCATLEQRLAHGVRVVEVELARKADDDKAVVPLDAGDRILADSGRFVAALGHDEDSSRMDNGMEVAEVAARAAGENFPVGSILFPRALRPHVRALYCYARLVDELGDAYDGDRLAALDELEAEVVLTFEGEPTWPVLLNVQPTVREFALPREPFLRLIEANRMDQRVVAYESWDDVKQYCVHSADPCGRLVLGVLRRLDDPELVAASDSVCTGLQLVNFLQDVPRDLELGRIYLPAEDRRCFGDPALDRPSDELRSLLRFEAERAAALLRAGDVLRSRIGGRLGRAVGLFARGGLAALDALESANWDLFTQRPKPSRARLAREAALVLVRGRRLDGARQEAEVPALPAPERDS
jgi:squalene synthase HpnC